MNKLYIAYGSNMNIKDMSIRCPTAKLIGKGVILGWKLVFRGTKDNIFATIENEADKEVPVVIWEIQECDEKRLDEY